MPYLLQAAFWVGVIGTVAAFWAVSRLADAPAEETV